MNSTTELLKCTQFFSLYIIICEEKSIPTEYFWWFCVHNWSKVKKTVFFWMKRENDEFIKFFKYKILLRSLCEWSDKKRIQNSPNKEMKKKKMRNVYKTKVEWKSNIDLLESLCQRHFTYSSFISGIYVYVFTLVSHIYFTNFHHMMQKSDEQNPPVLGFLLLFSPFE